MDVRYELVGGLSVVDGDVCTLCRHILHDCLVEFLSLREQLGDCSFRYFAQPLVVAFRHK